MASPQAPLTLQERIKSWLPFIYMVTLLLALRWTLVEPYVVPTGSMEPTLKPGDRLYALKCAFDVRFPFTEWILFRTGEVKRGDIILFRYPNDPSLTYVKRAVGLPGDHIMVDKGVVYVNGKAVDKSPTQQRGTMYDIESEETKTLFVEQLGNVKHYVILDRRIEENGMERLAHRFQEEVVVPPGHLFAMGDNRDNSSDSRVWGFVPYENLKGRALFIWYSSKGGWLIPGILWNPFWHTRYERIGTLLQ